MRPPDRQGRLAHSGRTGDHRDHRRQGLVAQPAVHGGQGLVPADEPREVHRQLARHDHLRRGCRCREWGRQSAEELRMHLAKPRTGIGAQFLDETPPNRLVLLQRLGTAAGRVECVEESDPQRFPQRVPADQITQLAGEPLVPAGGELEIDPAFDGAEIPLDQPWGLRLGEPDRAHALERVAAPQRKSVGEGARLGFKVGDGRGERDQFQESQGVDLLGTDPQQVADGGRLDELRPDQLPQPRHVRLHACPRIAGQLIAPHSGRQALGRHDGSG
jgi:hypothetical protein